MAKIQKSNEQNMIDADNRDKYVNGRPVLMRRTGKGYADMQIVMHMQ